MKKVLLLDIENVAVKADELFAFCEKYHRVYVSFAKTSAIFALQDIEPLLKVLNKKLFLIAMQFNKKSNGADFGLAFYAGRLSQEFKANKTKFHIMSSDQDFEHIAKLLNDKGFKVKQISNQSYRLDKSINDGTLPNLAEFKENIYLHDIKHLCDDWLKYWHKGNRPAKIKTLKGMIYQKTRLTDESLDKLVKLLQQYQLINVNNTKISYNHQHIKNWTMLDIKAYPPKKSQIKSRQKELSLPPKPEQLAGSLALKRLKNICELLFLVTDKPKNVAEFAQWLQDELNIDNEFSLQNITHLMQEYHMISLVNGRMIFNDEVIKNWAVFEPTPTHEHFVRIGDRLLTKGNVIRLKDELSQMVNADGMIDKVADESEYLSLARQIFPSESDELLMKLAIYQKWVVVRDGKVVYTSIG